MSRSALCLEMADPVGLTEPRRALVVSLVTRSRSLWVGLTLWLTAAVGVGCGGGPPAAHRAASCEAGYPDLCVPVDASDLDCVDVAARDFAVRGADVHGFDRDRDGIGCES